MFSKTIALFSIFAILAAAAPDPTTVTVASGPSVTNISQCDTGAAQCCDTVGQANTIPGVSAITTILGIVLQNPSVIVGLTCNPITVIGAGQGANCAQQPVCCTNNNFNGVIAVGCTPVSV